MKGLNVLFVSYLHVGVGKGGLYSQIIQTKNALEKLGCVVSFYSFEQTDLDAYDVIHFFGLDSLNKRVIEAAKASGVKIVVSPVFNRFGLSDYRYFIESKILINLPGFIPNIKVYKSLLRQVDSVIALNKKEESLLKKYFDLRSVVIIPNGLADTYISFMTKSGARERKEPFILCVGEICSRKNQLRLIKAAIKCNFSLILVGPYSKLEQDYVNECKELARSNPNIKIMGELKFGSDALIGLYNEAKVFCLASISEVEPLTLVEAAINNCNIVCSNTFPINEVIVEDVITFDPLSVSSISASLMKAMAKEASSKEYKFPSWVDVGNLIKSNYLGVVNESA